MRRSLDKSVMLPNSHEAEFRALVAAKVGTERAKKRVPFSVEFFSALRHETNQGPVTET